MRLPRIRYIAPFAAIIAIAAIAFMASNALAVVFDTGTYDLTVADKDHSTGLVDIGNASVEYIGSSASNQASGTGLFDPFVRLQGSPTEKGYNTDGTVAFDTKTGTWTHAIKVNAIPLVDCDGSGSGTATCWELFVDINDGNNTKRISLNEVEIWFTTNANLVGFVDPTCFPSGATKEYDFSGAILINDVNQGSGRGDLRYLVPTADHTWNADTYFVLYSKWGTTAASQTAANGTGNWGSDGGFEEWKVRKTPNVTIVKTADAASVNAGSAIGFTITVTNSGVADATGVTVSDPLPAGTGVDWSIASQSPSGSCSITGSPPAETLNCGPLTLAAGGGALTVHVTSPTTGGSCGVYDNTASFTSTNAGTGSDDASITVNCPDVKVEKTPDGSTINAGQDAVFTIVVTNLGPGPATNVTLTDVLPDSGLSWTVGGANAAACAGTNPHAGGSTLTCNFGTVPFPGSRTITLTSPTDQEDCRLISNTATVSATGDTNAANNSDNGAITPQCAAIIILKNSVKGGAVNNAGAVFSVDGPDADTVPDFSVTDNVTAAAPDEDADIGEVCVGGLAPGTYTVNETSAPTGYGGASQTNLSAVAVQGTNCTTSLPTGSAVVTFTNAPLFDVQINFRDAGSGETSATSINCVATGTISTTDATGWTDTETTEDIAFVNGGSGTMTITCSIVVDP